MCCCCGCCCLLLLVACCLLPVACCLLPVAVAVAVAVVVACCLLLVACCLLPVACCCWCWCCCCRCCHGRRRCCCCCCCCCRCRCRCWLWSAFLVFLLFEDKYLGVRAFRGVGLPGFCFCFKGALSFIKFLGFWVVVGSQFIQESHCWGPRGTRQRNLLERYLVSQTKVFGTRTADSAKCEAVVARKRHP